jgi:hypothetical protein
MFSCSLIVSHHGTREYVCAEGVAKMANIRVNEEVAMRKVTVTFAILRYSTSPGGPFLSHLPSIKRTSQEAIIKKRAIG